MSHRPYLLAVAALHVLGAVVLLGGVRSHPSLLGMGLLAYTLGLRHAFDADHVAAIDNSIRKLMHQGRSPSGVGFYFALGHSSIVLVLTFATAFVVREGARVLPQLQRLGGVAATAVSGVFLLLIGALNVAILRDVWRHFQAVRRDPARAAELEGALLTGGVVARLAAPLWRVVDRSWHVLLVGLLFGLGFDTASEVALLALSAGAASQHLPWHGVMVLPVLFAAGMSLLDTLDGMLMTGAYRWAAIHPLRKVYYNLTITGLSAAAALAIGGLRILQVAAAQRDRQGPFWTSVRAFDLGRVGYVLVGAFLVAWALSWAVWKLLRLDTPQAGRAGGSAR